MPHVFFVFNSIGTGTYIVKHFHKPVATWTEVALSTPTVYKSYLAVAMDSIGSIHLSWAERGNDRIRHQYPDGSTAILGSGLTGNLNLSMALTTDDEPVVCFSDGPFASASSVNTIRPDGGGGWTVETHWREADFSLFDMQLDSGGLPRLAYYDSEVRDLKMGEYSGSNWSHEVISADVGIENSLALSLGPTDLPNLAYRDSDTDAVMLQQYVFATFYFWKTPEEVDAAGGSVVNLAMDSANHPHLSYARNPDLHYAHHNGVSWSSDMAATGAIFGAQSLALATNDKPRISYLADWQDLMLATRYCNPICYWSTSGPFNTNSYDTRLLTLQVDGDSNPHVAAADQGLDYFWHDGASWSSRRISDEVDYLGGKYCAFNLGPSDTPYFTFSASTGDSTYALKYSTRFEFDAIFYWYTETIVPLAARALMKLHVDQAGQPHLIYLTDDNDLMYAVKNVAAADLRFTDMTLISPTQIQLHWGGSYEDIRVYRSPLLAPTAWTPVAGPVSGDNVTISKPSVKSFYQLKVEP